MKRMHYPFALLIGFALLGCVSNDDVKLCPDEALKTEPGVCGCDVEDVDSDGDTIMDCVDLCPEDSQKTKPGVCGCGVADIDSDGDTVMDCIDLCPNDPKKTQAGVCGCGVEDVDSDGDTMLDCLDLCPDDAKKTVPGVCGCGVEDAGENIADSDGDGIPNCIDGCPDNPYKTAPGDSTCEDRDSDGDGVEDLLDDCPYNPEIQELAEGEDCNLRTHTLENGEKVEVFEVWSAHDLLALRNRTEKLASSVAEGMPCFEYAAIRCEDAGTSNRAFFCEIPDREDDIPQWGSIECVGACQEVDGKGVCEPEKCKDPSANLEVGECCDRKTFESVCSADLKSYKFCEDGKVILRTCDYGEICDAERASCVDTVDTKLTVGGKAGDICETLYYRETCLDEHTFLMCESGMVVEKACDSTCYNTGTGATCYVASKDDVELRIELMQDIVLSDAFQPVKSSFGIQGIRWTPINLRRMMFDGKGHKIVASRDGSVVVNMPFFGNVVGSTVKDLTLEYDSMGAGYAVLLDVAAQSELERITYRGDRSFTASLLGEKGTSIFLASVLGQILFKSQLKDIVIDSEQWVSSGLFSSSAKCIYENLDVNVKNFNGSGGYVFPIGNSSYHDVIRGAKFTYGNIEVIGGLKNSITMVSYLGHVDMENVEFNIDSALQNFVMGESTFSLVEEVYGSHLSHITMRLGNIGERVYGFSDDSDGAMTCSHFKLVNSLYHSSFDTIKISADRIKASNFSGVSNGDGNESYISGLDVNIHETDVDEYFYLFDLSLNLENSKIHYDTLKARYAYPFFNVLNHEVKNVELTADRMSVDLAYLFASGQEGVLDYFTAHIKEVYARDYVVGWNSFEGNLKHSAVRIDKFIEPIEGDFISSLFYRLSIKGSLSDSSFYINKYARAARDTGSFVDWIDGSNSGKDLFTNVVVSGETFLYQGLDGFEMKNVTPVENPVWARYIDSTVEEPVTGTLYWLKRTSEAEFFRADEEEEFTPYYWDKTLDASPESALDTDAVIQLLGKDWSALTLSNENKNTIPWFTGKMPTAEESGTPAE